MIYEKIIGKAPQQRVLLEDGERVKGYKALGQDRECRGFMFEEGEEYHHAGTVEPCASGFHFCLNAVDCLSYYPIDSIFVEVEAWGEIIADGTKLCALYENIPICPHSTHVSALTNIFSPSLYRGLMLSPFITHI